MDMRTKLFITVLALMALTTLASAQTVSGTQNQQNTTVNGVAYVDANNNNICDNFENRTVNTAGNGGNGYCRFNERGRQGQGMGQGQRLRFRNGTGQGLGAGRGMGAGRGRNFVDADKNGVCDLYETATKK
jgi:hypothetical protein